MEAEGTGGGKRRRRRVVAWSEVDRQLIEEGKDPAAVAPPLTAKVLPDRAREDSDQAWGDGRDSNDRRLREDVPPHWGRR